MVDSSLNQSKEDLDISRASVFNHYPVNMAVSRAPAHFGHNRQAYGGHGSSSNLPYEEEEDEIEESIHEDDCINDDSQQYPNETYYDQNEENNDEQRQYLLSYRKNDQFVVGAADKDSKYIDESDEYENDDDSEYAILRDRDLDQSHKMFKVIKHITNLATPNTISSNVEKLKRGISRDSDRQFNNGTMVNFGGVGTQSSRSNSMTTPLMFPQKNQAKLREISKFRVTGMDSFHKDKYGSNFNVNSPTVHGRQRLEVNISPSRTNYMQGFHRMSQANYAVLQTELMRHQSCLPPSHHKAQLSLPNAAICLAREDYSKSKQQSSSRLGNQLKPVNPTGDSEAVLCESSVDYRKTQEQFTGEQEQILNVEKMKIQEENDDEHHRTEQEDDQSSDSLPLKENSIIIAAVTSNREEDEPTLDEGDYSLYNLDCKRSSLAHSQVGFDKVETFNQKLLTTEKRRRPYSPPLQKPYHQTDDNITDHDKKQQKE